MIGGATAWPWRWGWCTCSSCSRSAHSACSPTGGTRGGGGGQPASRSHTSRSHRRRGKHHHHSQPQYGPSLSSLSHDHHLVCGPSIMHAAFSRPSWPTWTRSTPPMTPTPGSSSRPGRRGHADADAPYQGASPMPSSSSWHAPGGGRSEAGAVVVGRGRAAASATQQARTGAWAR